MAAPAEPAAGVFRTRGQRPAMTVVARAIRTTAPQQALLLTGPTGTGKTTLALDLAAGLLCAASPDARPCRTCAACRRVAHGNHPDVHRLAPEGPGRQIRIGNRDAPDPGTVRHLLHELALAPAEGRFRVVVVEEAHRLNEDAQNALLKALEEPPPGTCVILCAENEDALLPTVRSRCVRVRCGPVAETEIAALLVERGLADSSRAARLAAMAAGRPGRALALARSPEAVVLRDRIVRQLLDLTSAAPAARLAVAGELVSAADDYDLQLERGLAASSAEDPARTRAADAGRVPPRSGPGLPPSPTTAAPAQQVDRAEEIGRADEAACDGADPAADGADPAAGRSPGARRARARMAPAERRRALVTLGALWRDLARDLALTLRGGAGEIRQRDLRDELAAAAADLDPAGVAEFLSVLDRCLALVDGNANPELVLDVLLLRWPRPSGVA